MIRVYHLNREAFEAHLHNFNMGEFAQDGPNFPEDYVHVANVNSHAVEDAYRLTNHIDDAWWNNEGVTLIGEPKHRSTSIGDVVVLVDHPRCAGQVLRCANFGWDSLPNIDEMRKSENI